MYLINDGYLTCEQQAIIDMITREEPVLMSRIVRFMNTAYNMSEDKVDEWLMALLDMDLVTVKPGGMRLNRDRR